MGEVEIYELIERIVNLMDRNVYIDSISQIGATNQYLILTCNTKWIDINGPVNISAVDYRVVDIVANTSFTIELETGQTAPVADSFLAPIVYFEHGQIKFVDQERVRELAAAYKYPFMYLNEPFTERDVSDPTSSVKKYADFSLFAMMLSNNDKWTKDQHYQYAIKAAASMISEFKRAAQYASFVGILDDVDFRSETRVKWGSLTENGSSKNIFSENLSGKKMDVSGFPFSDDGCCADEYIMPSNEPATVENSDQSYTASVNAGGTLILPDETFNVYVDSVLQQTITIPALSNSTININWT